MKLMSEEDYRQLFEKTADPNDDSRNRALLQYAIEARVFEIEQYWKRASYFWTLIAATFVGYFALTRTDPRNYEGELLVGCLGLVFTVAWYAVNRGSSLWHYSWDNTVELLERRLIGPLHSIHLVRREPRLFDFGGFYFSGSRVHEITGMYVMGIWIYLACKSLSCEFGWREPFGNLNYYLIGGLSVIALIVILVWGRGSCSSFVLLRDVAEGN